MDSSDIFEIHQGEWAYLTDGDRALVLATANVAQCTVFCGRSGSAFAFMFHFDLPTTSRLRTLKAFDKVVRSRVRPGSTIEYHLDGGWSCAWSHRVRSHITQFVTSLHEFHFVTDPQPLPFTNKSQRFLDGQWKKGVSFDRVSGQLQPFPVKTQTERRRPIRAYFPWFELQLCRP